MCGIFLGEKENKEIIKLIRNRGKDLSNTVNYNGLVLCSSVLTIRDKVQQPIIEEDFAFLYNGEIYNNTKSDTNWIKETIFDILKTSTVKNFSVSEIANLIYQKINEFENELALVVLFKDNIIFFKDDIGRKSLGFNENPFMISSVCYQNNIDNLWIYIYDLKTKTIIKRLKECFLSFYYIHNFSKIAKYIKKKTEYSFLNYQNIDNIDKLPNYSLSSYGLEELLIKSVDKRIIEDDIVILFSGGIDSNLIAVLLIQRSKLTQKIILINASFENSIDRKNATESFKSLINKFPDRNISLIIVDLKIDEIKSKKEHIYCLINPKTSRMDFNIGVVLYYASLEASKYSKVCYLGSGADEMFCGYKKYNGEDFRDEMLFDLFTISYQNTTRDDRCISDNNIEPRFPFLDCSILKYSFSISDTEIKNKKPLRDILISYGMKDLANLKKTAMQFGSGIFKIEKKL